MRLRVILNKWNKTTIRSCVVSLLLFCLALDTGTSSGEKPVPSNVPSHPPQTKEAGPARNQGEHKIEDALKNAFQYLQSKNYIKAKEAYRSVYLSAKKGPAAEKALFGLGKSEYYLKHYYEAKMNLHRFISQYPESEHLSEAYLLLGNASVSLKKYKDALQYFERVGGTFKDMAHIGEAAVALGSGDVAKADSLLGKVNKKLLESDPRALSVKALIYSRKGMYNQALNAINKVPEPALKDQDLRTDKARILFEAGKITEAERLCRNILTGPTSSSESFDAKKILLRIYEAAGKTDDVLKLSLELTSLEKDDGFRLKIVSLYDQKGDFDSALKHLVYVKDKGTRSIEIAKRLKSMIDSKDPKAIEYIMKYSGYTDPESPFIVEASRYLIANGKKQEGMSLLKRTKGTESGENALYIAELMINEGKNAEAKRILEGMVFDMKHIAKTSALMSSIMEKEGNFSAAIEYLKKVLRLAKDSRIYSSLGNLYWKTGEKANASKFYVMASDMGDGTSSVKAGDCFYLAGEKKKAEHYYKKALNQKISDTKDLQWARYQYGKLAGKKDYLKKAAEGGGDVASAAAIILGEN